MDLLTKVVVYAVAIVAVLFALYYAATLIPKAAPTQQQAERNITGYLNDLYPGANVTITDIRPSVYANSWYVLASVIANASTPCPSYQTYYYDYPQFSLVNGTENKYTTGFPNCTVYNYEPGTPLGSAPAAITLASNNATVWSGYVERFGFANIRTSAVYNETATSPRNFSEVWWITYAAPSADYSMLAAVSQKNGSVLTIVNVSTVNASK